MLLNPISFDHDPHHIDITHRPALGNSGDALIVAARA
jgi:hypothetical protein